MVLLASLLAVTIVAQAQPGIVRGQVLDRAGGAPIADVSVRIEESGAAVATDAAGRFEITGVTPGRHVVYVSLVGFILVKKPVDVVPGASVEITVVLSEGTGTYSETVDVSGERFREAERAVPSQQSLGSADIQNLRGLLTNDPMRAIQVLPGVTSGDDFRSEFAVRGSPFTRMNFTFDGIPTSFLLHTVQQVQDGGSIAMMNGDILDGIELLSGSYPQRYGNRLGAELDFHMREGSRDRMQTRLNVSGTDASVVVEGPLGKRKAGSWLVSARKSYLEVLLRQISDVEDDLGFGFSDAQGKLAYDVSPRQHVELTLVAGHSGLDQTSSPDARNAIDDGSNSAALVNGAWRFTPSSSFSLTERVALAVTHFQNSNPIGVQLGFGGGTDVTWRSDAAVALPRHLSLEAGSQIQRQQRDETVRHAFAGAGFVTLGEYDTSATLSSAYAHLRWEPSTRVTLAGGGRVDHWTLTHDATASPWMQAETRLVGTLKLRAAAGIARQFAGFNAFGAIDTPSLFNSSPERAYHSDIGVEQAIGSSARWQITAYHRRERDILRPPCCELHLDPSGSSVVLGTSDAWRNSLDGYARGVEFLVQRRSTSGLSGWVSYAYGVNRYTDRFTHESFDGDFDQRHTFNAYGFYRLTNRLSLAAKVRVGSNTPAVGYWEARDGNYFLSSVRNTVRVPTYARADIRGSRAFNWQRTRLTLFAEVLNILGRDNVRLGSPHVNGNSLQVLDMFDTMIPRVPSLGMLLEF